MYEHIHIESRKMRLMNLFAGQHWRRRHREQICGHRWEGQWDELRAQQETCMLPYVKQIASGNLLHDSGSSNQCPVTI